MEDTILVVANRIGMRIFNLLVDIKRETNTESKENARNICGRKEHKEEGVCKNRKRIICNVFRWSAFFSIQFILVFFYCAVSQRFRVFFCLSQLLSRFLFNFIKSAISKANLELIIKNRWNTKEKNHRVECKKYACCDMKNYRNNIGKY